MKRKNARVLALLMSGCSRRTAASSVNCHPKTILNTAKRDQSSPKDSRWPKTPVNHHIENINKAGRETKTTGEASAWMLERLHPTDSENLNPDTITPRKCSPHCPNRGNNHPGNPARNIGNKSSSVSTASSRRLASSMTRSPILPGLLPARIERPTGPEPATMNPLDDHASTNLSPQEIFKAVGQLKKDRREAHGKAAGC